MMLRRAPLLCLWGSTVLALLRAPTVPARHRLSTPLCVDGATLALDDEGAYAEDETKFVAWLEAELADAPGRTDYPEIFVDASAAVLQWRRRFRGDRKLWQRLMKDRVLKEIVERARTAFSLFGVKGDCGSVLRRRKLGSVRRRESESQARGRERAHTGWRRCWRWRATLSSRASLPMASESPSSTFAARAHRVRVASLCRSLSLE